ncbi:hypothetical protein AB1R73_001951, partial [Neisseria gonorrhoeae]
IACFSAIGYVVPILSPTFSTEGVEAATHEEIPVASITSDATEAIFFLWDILTPKKWGPPYQ